MSSDKVVWLMDMTPFAGKKWGNLPDVVRSIYGNEAVIETKFDPFHNEPLKLPDGDERIVIPYGGIRFCNYVERELSPKHVIFKFHSDLFKPSMAMSYGKLNTFLNADARFETWGMIKQKFQTSGKLFIKPNIHYKTFTGFVWDMGYDDAVVVENTYSLFPTDMLLVADPKPIEQEYRFFVVGGKIVGYGEYSYEENHVNLYENFDLAKEFAQDNIHLFASADQNYTIDIAISEGKPKIVEFNSINSSGLYDCNMKDFVKAVTEEAISLNDHFFI
ncbi:putative D-alanine D-alanine ligase [Ochrobactrum phage vB_OspM_OC]|nr:putative D-alanine D-alanine ligase [Ochrobactrum phage vB_OspM_OC]